MSPGGKSESRPRESSQIESLGAAILETQLQTLLGEVQHTFTYVEELVKDRGNGRLASLAETLVEFASFSQDYFDIFKKRKSPDQNHLQQVLDKIQREWLNLRPLVEQRCLPYLAEWLKIADVIADDCLITGENTPPSFKPCFTFFEKTNHIANYAYSRVPGIALPLANLDSPWLWLGLGHEVGHYLYWNLPHVNKPSLKESLAESVIYELWRKLFTELYQTAPTEEDDARRIEQLSAWYSWLEEIFADIYGTLIFGPAYIYSLMAWLRLRVKPATVLEDDTDHAPPLLRPLIQVQALQELEFQNLTQSPLNNGVIEAIKTEWQGYWGSLTPDQTGFNYWLEQPMGQSKVQDYIRLSRIVAKEVVTAIARLQIIPQEKYYNAQIHLQVTEAALKINNPKEKDIQLPLDRPALALAVAWYAFSENPNKTSKEGLKAISQWVKTSIFNKLLRDEQLELKQEIITWPIKLERSTSFCQQLADILVALVKGQEAENIIKRQLGLKSLENDKLLDKLTQQSNLSEFLESLGGLPDLIENNQLGRDRFQGALKESDDDFWKYVDKAQSRFALVDRVIDYLLEREFSILVSEDGFYITTFPYPYGGPGGFGGYVGHGFGGFGPPPYPYGFGPQFSRYGFGAGYNPSFQPYRPIGYQPYRPVAYYRPPFPPYYYGRRWP